MIAAQTLLAGVGTVHFGPTSTYTAGGHKSTIAQGNPTKIVLSPGGVFNEATPSALGQGGQSFNDCAYSQTCKGAVTVAPERSASVARPACGQ